MVWFNTIGAGGPASFVLKNTSSSGSNGSSAGSSGSNSSSSSGSSTSGSNSTGSMNSTNGTTGAGDTSQTSSKKDDDSSAASAAALQDRFLTLLVAQMRNQDPLNPLENAEVTTQMAQISTVEGVARMNTTMSAIAASTGMNRASASTGLIGQDVFVPGNKLSQDSTGGAMRSGVTLDGAAEKLTVELIDASGKVVDQRTWTDVDAGTISIDWDGSGSDKSSYGAGEYTVRATVMSDAKANATTLTTERVTGVVDSAEGVMALLANGKQIAISKINGVFQSRTGTTDESRA